jgi:hypothetical protein
MRFRRRPRYRGIVPVMAAGPKMSSREYEQWREAHSWDPSRETRPVIQGDLAPAAWPKPLLVPGSFEVRKTVPQGFEAYVRVFFPLAGADIVQDGVVTGTEHITWAEMARRNGRVAHALMEQETIAGVEHGMGDRGLAEEQLAALQPILARHTASAAGWFLLWDGFGDLSEQHSATSRSHGSRPHYPERSRRLASWAAGWRASPGAAGRRTCRCFLPWRAASFRARTSAVAVPRAGTAVLPTPVLAARGPSDRRRGPGPLIAMPAGLLAARAGC